jgi:26S proteasome non-ATPase regulatory subunit 9
MSRARVLELSQSKDILENEIQSLVSYLTAPGMPGLKGPLTDSEGFPLSGLDLYAIREARQKFNKLNNDYSSLMNQIESELHSFFGNPSKDQVSIEKPQSSEISVSLRDRPIPFAEITEVSSDSPAETAGFQIFDKIVTFGTVNYLNSNGLSTLQEFVKTAEGTDVRVVLLRGESVLNLVLRPKRWAGNGIIGCRFRPI